MYEWVSPPYEERLATATASLCACIEARRDGEGVARRRLDRVRALFELFARHDAVDIGEDGLESRFDV